MDLIQYFFLALASASGLVAGAVVTKYSEEEMKIGAKYVRALMTSSLYLSIFFVAQKQTGNIAISTATPTIIILFLIFLPKVIPFLKEQRSVLVLFLLSASLYYSQKNGLDYVVPSLIFISLLCVGSMTYFTQRKKVSQNLTMKISFFLLPALVLALFAV